MNWILNFAKEDPSFRRSLIAAMKGPGDVWQVRPGLYKGMNQLGVTVSFRTEEAAQIWAQGQGRQVRQEAQKPTSVMDLLKNFKHIKITEKALERGRGIIEDDREISRLYRLTDEELISTAKALLTISNAWRRNSGTREIKYVNKILKMINDRGEV